MLDKPVKSLLVHLRAFDNLLHRVSLTVVDWLCDCGRFADLAI